MDQLTEREMENLRRADRLNAIMAQSSIPQAAEAAQLRGREQAAQRLQRSKQDADLQDLILDSALDRSSGPFEGTGIEAQMLNQQYRQWVADGKDPAEFMNMVSKQRLGRERTIVTPDGTEIVPGYNLEGGPAPKTEFVPKKPTEGERKGNYTIGTMRAFDQRIGGYAPNVVEGYVEQNAPEYLKGYFQSDDYRSMINDGREWVSNLIFLRSGQAAPDAEVQRAMTSFLPQPGDSATQIQEKEQRRAVAMAEAEKAYDIREGGGAPQTKVLDGVTYEKRNGKWFKVN